MKKFILILLLPILLFSANINDTLVKSDNIKVYESLLLKIKSKDSNNSEAKLQESLLYKIINITKYKKELKSINISNIKTDEELIDTFLNIIDLYKDYLIKLEDIRKKEKNLETLKLTIKKIDENDKKLLTLQLQYAFYYKSYKRLQKDIKYFEKNLNSWLLGLSKKLNSITLENSKIEKKILKKEEELKDLNNQIQVYKLEYDRLLLLDRKDRLKSIKESLVLLDKNRAKLIKRIIKDYLFLYLKEAKYKDKKGFKYKKKIEDYLTKIADKDNFYTNAFISVLDSFTKIRYGKTKVLVAETKETLIDFSKYVWNFLKQPLFSLNEKNINILDILKALFIFIFGVYIGNLYRKYIKKLSKEVTNLTQASRTLLSNIGYYFILILSFFISLKAVGIDFTSLTLIAGALSVGIGFGLQNIVSNFISGIILMFEKSIKIGDFIEINEELKGIVSDISMRSTTITTNDNIDIIIPNQTFIQNSVINWTLSSDVRRIRIPFSVAYGSNIQKVKKAIINALYDSDLDFIRKDPFRRPLVVLKAMGSSSVDLELFVWVKGEKTLTPRVTKGEFLEIIYKALYDNNIEIPFPQLDLHIKEPIDVKIDSNIKNRI